MIKKLAIFDLDGTILDTLDDLTDSTNYALTINGLPVHTKDDVRSFVGNGIRNLIDRSVPAGTDEGVADKVFDDFKSYYKLHCADKTKPYEGIEELFGALHEQNCHIAVVSNKADFAVQELCDAYFPGLIDYAAGEKEGVSKKPAPDAIFSTLVALNVTDYDAVYIGDSEVDVKTAENARVDCISVTWGFRDIEFIKSQGGYDFANTVDELKNKLIR